MEALRALAVLAEPPCPGHGRIAEALGLPPVPGADAHTEVLVFQVHPYASVYLGAEGMLGGEARDRIAGFWRAIGAVPPAEPDHASVLFGALAGLAEAEARGSDPRLRAARSALYWEHVASWMPPFLQALQRIGEPFHAAWADALDVILAAEAALLGPPASLPVALRAAPGPGGEPADVDELLRGLLAPARTGLVLARDDLRRCAAELGFGLRAGERRFALRGLLGQDGRAVLAWLAAEADRQAAAYDQRRPIADWWRARALAGARWLGRLASAAGHATMGAGG